MQWVIYGRSDQEVAASSSLEVATPTQVRVLGGAIDWAYKMPQPVDQGKQASNTWSTGCSLAGFSTSKSKLKIVQRNDRSNLGS